ncbi:MAG: tetratricopeptide repeat protein [Bacteroidota bacterium]
MKTTKYLILLKIVWLSMHLQAFGFNPDSLVHRANQAYAEGNYEQAIEWYSAVVDSGYESAALYYNLGNACFKSNKNTRAILNYERAKLLDPTDDEILFNLELARAFVVDEIEPLPEFILVTWFRQLIQSFKVDTWAWMSVGLFTAGLFFFILYLFSRKYAVKKSGFIFGIIATLFSLFAFSMAGLRKNWQENHNTAIIFEPNVTIKSAPDESGTNLFVLHEGTKVKVVDKVGEWNEIVIASGNKGWLRAESVEPI